MKENVKVTNLNGWYHARYFVDDQVKSEWRCQDKIDITWMCREMLRWRDKLGHTTPFTSAARKRQTGKPVGKVEQVK